MQEQFIGLIACGNGNGRALWKLLAEKGHLSKPSDDDDEDVDDKAKAREEDWE
jgi:hypothetical protein